MPGDIEFTIDAVSQSGQGMSGAGEQIQEKIAAFQSTLEGFGNPFGGDDIGSTMQMVYDAIREAAMESFEDNAASVAETGGEIVGMSETYAEIDRSNSDMFSNLLGEMDR